MIDGGSATDISTALWSEADVAHCHAGPDELTGIAQFRKDAHRFEAEVHSLRNHDAPPGDIGTFDRGGRPLHSGSREVLCQECAIYQSSLVSYPVAGACSMAQCCTSKLLRHPYGREALAVEHQHMRTSAVAAVALLSGHSAGVAEWVLDPEPPS